MSTRPWEIEVLHSDGKSEVYSVPAHRLSERTAKQRLKALVAKYEGLTPREVVDSYLNRRLGGPLAGVIDEAKYFANADNATAGFAIHARTSMRWHVGNRPPPNATSFAAK